MSEQKNLGESLSDVLFAHAIEAQKAGDKALRDSYCFWTQIVNAPSLTRDNIYSYIKGLERRAIKENHKNSQIVAKVFHDFLTNGSMF